MLFYVDITFCVLLEYGIVIAVSHLHVVQKIPKVRPKANYDQSSNAQFTNDSRNFKMIKSVDQVSYLQVSYLQFHGITYPLVLVPFVFLLREFGTL